MVDRAKGAKGRVVVDEENVDYGVDPVSPDGRIVNVMSCSLNPEQGLINDESLRANRNMVAPVQGNINVAGAIAVNLSETSHALLFKHLFGDVVTTGAGDPYTHTIKPGDLPIGLVISKEFTDIGEYHKNNGCRIASADISVTPEGLVPVTFNVIGQKTTRSASPYDATPTSYDHRAFSSFQASLEEGGSSIATVTDFKITISNELDEDGFAVDNNAFRRDLIEGDVKVTGSIEAFFTDDALLAKARAGTETSLKLTLDKGATPARTVEIFVPELLLELSGPSLDGPKGIKQSFNFTAYYDNSTEAASVQVTIQNGLATL